MACSPPADDEPDARAYDLTDLGIQRSAAGHPEEALAAEQEAVAIRRDLAATEPDRHRPDLALSLNNLGITLLELGRPGRPSR